MLQYSTVTPTNRSYETLKGLLLSLSQQTILPEQVIILYDKKLSLDEHKVIEKQCYEYKKIGDRIMLITEHSDKNFTVGKGASWLRNYGFNKVSTPLVLAVDDDNEFVPDFSQQLLQHYTKLFGQGMGVVQPIEEYRKTGTVRFSGYSGFSPFWVRPIKIPYDQKQTEPYKSFIAPSNCFLGSVELFKQYPFVEKLKFVYEDFLFFATLSQHGYPVFMCPGVTTHHMMTPRNRLQNLYIENPERSFQKTRNRSILMKAIASPLDLLVYYTLGWWLQSGRQGLHIVLFAPRKDKLPLCRAVIRGSIVGLFSSKN